MLLLAESAAVPNHPALLHVLPFAAWDQCQARTEDGAFSTYRRLNMPNTDSSARRLVKGKKRPLTSKVVMPASARAKRVCIQGTRDSGSCTQGAPGTAGPAQRGKVMRGKVRGCTQPQPNSMPGTDLTGQGAIGKPEHWP
eukprot:691938-Pelagomonas_calceolata.AAC.5